MDSKMNIQWFPGHMTKTRRKIEQDIKIVDAVVEVLDSRIPISSRNPDIAEITINKPRIILLNKSDMADPKVTNIWVKYFNSKGFTTLPIDCESGKGINHFVPSLKTVLNEKIENFKRKGMINPTMRVMIVGIPNVGKSTFINRISSKNKAKVADKPGVTRGNQWFTVSKGFDVLDTPGVLWPKFDDEQTALNLAFTGAIKDQIMDIELLAIKLLDLMKKIKPEGFILRFKLKDEDLISDSYELLNIIGKKRGMLISGGEVDTERASVMLLDEFRGAKFGRITLEEPKE